MGTSKGYIPPTTPKWISVKRGVTTYLKNTTESNKKEVISRFAKAIVEDKTTIQNVAFAFSKFSLFVLKSQGLGLLETLNEYALKFIIDLPPEEAIVELTNVLCERNTIDDCIAVNCIYISLEKLGVKTMDDLSHLNIIVMIKEFICQFAMQKFAQMFDKDIKNKSDSVSVANERIRELQEYIYNTLMINLTNDSVLSLDSKDLANEEVIIGVLQEAFEILEKYYD